jgi:hypothetical protein
MLGIDCPSCWFLFRAAGLLAPPATTGDPDDGGVMTTTRDGDDDDDGGGDDARPRDFNIILAGWRVGARSPFDVVDFVAIRFVAKIPRMLLGAFASSRLLSGREGDQFSLAHCSYSLVSLRDATKAIPHTGGSRAPLSLL